jgi:DNA-binding transcriptional LysR family regulator
MKVFLKVAEVESFTKAADALFLSQPAVSLQIQKLEQLFQTSLFIRAHSDHIRLTEAGENLRQHADALMKAQQALIQDMEKYSAGHLRELRIGACCIAGEQLLPIGLSSFRESYPRAKLTVAITKCEEVFNGLLAGNFDIGVTGLEPKRRFSRDLHKQKLMEVPLVLFETSKTASPTGQISLKQLRSHRLILSEKGSGCRTEFEQFLSKNKRKLHEYEVVCESESNDAIKELVKDGYGISMLPEFMVRKEIAEGIFSEISLIEDSPVMSFFLIYRKQDNLSKMQNDLIAFLSAYPKQESTKEKGLKAV